MRTRTLVILAALAALALGGWWTLRGSVRRDAGVVDRRPLFGPDEIPVESVDRIRLERPGAGVPAIEFRRTASGWDQVQPFPHPADPAALRQVLDTAAALESTRAVDPAALDDGARAALGLDPPRARLVIGWPGGERAVELGRRTVAGRAWVRVGGRGEVVSVDASLHAAAVEGDPRQWRATRLLDAAGADVARIEVRYGPGDGQFVALARSGGSWRVERPFATRADSESARGYVDALLRAEIDAFASDSIDDPGAFGLALPEKSVRLLTGPGAGGEGPRTVSLVEVGVEVAEGAPERFARIDGRPTVVQLGNKALAALFPPPAFFVDPRGCAAVPADVRRIEFRRAGSAAAGAMSAPIDPDFVLERSLDEWSIRVPADAASEPADRERTRRLLAQLCEARAPAVAFQPMPEALMRGEFRLFGAGDAELGRVRVAREEAGQWALDNADGVLRVHPAGFDVATDAAAYVGTR